MSSRNPAQSRVIYVLSVANFIIGMGAFVVIGLINPIAETFQITASEAGWTLTAYAIAYAIGSPLCVALSGRVSRRSVLLFGLSLFAAGSLLSAMAASADLLNTARLITALGAGMVTPVAAAVALATALPGREGKALAGVFFGLTVAQVLGVPVGSFIGYTLGWQSAFVIVFVLTLAAMAGVWLVVPASLSFQVNTLSTLLDAVLDWRSFVSVLFTATFIATYFVLYTYMAPLLSQTMDYGRDGIVLTLLIAGVGAIAGNILGGRLTDSLGPFKTLILACSSQILFLPLYSWLPLPDWLFLTTILVWSVCGWTFMVAQQSRIVAQAPERQNVVLALNAAAIYLGTALGSALGGTILDWGGLSSLGIAGGLCGVLALIHLMLSEHWARQRSMATAPK